MNKRILFDKEAREKVIIGVNTMADVVGVTLGPAGRCVLISDSVMVDYGIRSLPISVTKDGVSASRKVHLADPVENVGAIMLREAAEKTMLLCGDGTTTTCVLARAIVKYGMELISAGENPMKIKKELDEAVKYIVERLSKMSNTIGEDVEKIKQIATVSANNDSYIGELIGEAFEKIGRDGLIDIEEAKGVKTEIKIMDGFSFDKGYITPYFITDRAKSICELIEPNILLYEKELRQMKPFESILIKSVETGKPLLIICEDCDGEALSALVMNTLDKRIKVCVVKYPTFGESKMEMMEDIAALTGATYLTDSKGIGLERAALEHLGKAKKITISQDRTIIVGGEKNKETHTELLNDLRMNLTQAKGEDEKEKIENRIARLVGGVAVIYVGGPTETEMKELKDRVDDAVRATKSALAEGYVPGGGTSFLRSLDRITSGQMNDCAAGFKILLPVLEEPLRQICRNAGVDESKILKQVSEESGNVGYNARTGEITDLLEAGIIDPTKVLRCSLQNAASVAGMILTSQCVIVDSLT